jgi:hypothetical protein
VCADCARHPKPDNGLPPVGLERMLRIYFLQHWFSLSDPAVEEALYGSMTIRNFAGLSQSKRHHCWHVLRAKDFTNRRYRHNGVVDES